MRPTSILTAGILALGLLAAAAFDSFETIEPGERGIVVSFGQIVGTAASGVNIKAPFVTQIPKFNLRDQIIEQKNLEVYTYDKQVATVPGVSAVYSIDPARVEEIYLRYGSTENMVEQLIRRQMGGKLEQVFGQFTADTAVTNRTGLSQKYAEAIRDVGDAPLLVSQVVIEDFSLPDEYERNVNERMTAEVNALKAEQEAKKTVTDAKAAADAAIETARGKAEAVRLAGLAEAAAIKARGDALRSNPELIALTTAERWDGVLPTQMVPDGALPFVNLTAPTKVQ